MSNIVSNHEYRQWLTDLKSRIRSSQIKAALSVNSELISLYWDLGRMIVEKQSQSRWGSKLIEQLAKDLKAEFPDMSGFSTRNLFFTRQFYLFYSNPESVQQVVSLFEHGKKQQAIGTIRDKKVPQLVGKSENEIVNQIGSQLKFVEQLVHQIPWRHHVLILQKTKDPEEAVFYIRETINNNWSRNILGIQIESGLYRRQGKAVSNFSITLPKPQSDLATQILKDPYNFQRRAVNRPARSRSLLKQA